MHPIIPHLWYTTQAVEAVQLYTSLFPNSTVSSHRVIHNTPSGDCDILSFTLAGQEMMAINGGPFFTMNPSLSFYVPCTSEEEITTLWTALSEGGKSLMPLDQYPWAERYGWVSDRYGLSWQLIWRKDEKITQKILPNLMFTGPQAGRAAEAIAYYTNLFPNSSLLFSEEYKEGEQDTPGYIKHAQFTLNAMKFVAMDSSYNHGFSFNEAMSLIITCDTQEEIDHYWEALSHVPEAEQCGWVKDQFGISWQIVPTAMQHMMTTGTPEQMARVTQAFLSMKKFIVKDLEKAFYQ